MHMLPVAGKLPVPSSDQRSIVHVRRPCSAFLLHSSVQNVEGLFVVVVCVFRRLLKWDMDPCLHSSVPLSHFFPPSPTLASLFIMKRSDSFSVLSPLCNYPFAASVCVEAPLKRAHFSSPFKLYFIVDASGLCLFIWRVIGERNK